MHPILSAKRFRSFISRLAAAHVLAAVFTLSIASAGRAQSSGWIEGVVQTSASEALTGALVRLSEPDAQTLTDESGRFLLGPVPPGRHELSASIVGYGDAVRSIEVRGGDTVRVQLALDARPIDLAGVTVSVLRPDMQPEAELQEREVREATPRDVGELLRELPGMGSVRRGPLGLDPVVRGLRETEVGVYLDDTRIFPGGAARMDSPLSHLDPSALKNIQVVKGPYALTWGAGNLSAIRVETQHVPPAVPGPFHGEFVSGYDSNLNAAEGAASVFGKQGRVSYWGHGVWREGDNYETGSGAVIPADFLSREARGKLGYQTSAASRATFSAGYQDQTDIDYPGRLLDASFLETYNLSARWELARSAGLLRALDVLAYVNDVDHGMDNDEKPTAQPNPDRVPPFPLFVEVNSGVHVVGGRLAATVAPGADSTLELGGDVYRAHRNALRTISNQETGMIMFEDLMWPDATITDAGIFARVAPPLGDRFSAAATLRLDVVRADADTASAFFLGNVSDELDSRETNLSAAVTATAALSSNWSASVGVGSAVRTPDAAERYSDRIPASKAQTSAEFMGNPALEPERSTQTDLWLEASYSRFSLQLNAFWRKMDDYITLEGTTLPKRLPLSPDTVFSYVNGDATFWGAEASATYAILDPLTFTAAGSYLWGRDETADEPALGVAPFRGDLALRYEPQGGPSFIEATLRAVADQDRVATTRGELPTEGYVTVDLKSAIELSSRVLVRFGVTNVADAEYVNHLNAKNPFEGVPVPEPGRSFFARLSYAF